MARTASLIVGDLGCGAGGMFDVLREYGAVLGFDISALAASICRAKRYAGVAVATVERLPVHSGILDLVAMTDVLEHVEDNEAALGECWRVLKPGGLAVITVPAVPWLYGAHDRALGHLRRYSERDIRNLLLLCRFEVERVTYFNALLLPAAILTRLLPTLLPGASANAPPKTEPLDLMRPLNSLAYHALLTERAILRFTDLPFGLSLLCLGRKPPEWV